jgi:LmbE family N-acetylglucosaminyl deacetylase
MISLPLFNSVRRVLALGAHSDDIEIGLGGTLLQAIQSTPDLEIYWVVFSAPGPRCDEAQASAGEFLAGIKRQRIRVGNFRESYFPSEWSAIKDWFEEIRSTFDPDLVFTHYRNDRHQDHRVLSDLAWNTFRNHLILEYEILKYDGDLGTPNLYVPLSEEAAALKVRLLMKHFATQRSKHWFTPDTFGGRPAHPGVESASARAEAFYSRKLVLG